MQDIVYRKAASSHSHSASLGTVAPAAPKAHRRAARDLSRVSLVVEQIIEHIGVAGNWLVQTFRPQPKVKVVAAPRLLNATVEQTAAKLQPHTREKLVVTAKRTGAKAKERVKGVGRAARTPLGKVTLVQTAALFALFAYVAHLTPSKTPTAPGALASDSRNVGEGTANTLHQFLPTAQDYVQPQPFQEAQAEKVAKTPLHAWAAPWNLDTVAANASSYSTLSAFWLTLQSDGMSVQPKADWGQWQAFITKNKQPNEKLYLTVTGDPAVVLAGIIDPTSRKDQIANLLQTVQQQGFDGIDIDYEGLGQANRDTFTSFIGDLTQAFHAQSKLVAVTLEAGLANQVPQDWHAVSLAADQVRIMAYDYHSSQTDSPGPVAPLGWLKELMDYASVTIDPTKLVVGLGNYGYDWQKPDSPDQSWKGSAVSFDQASALAKQWNAPVTRASGIDQRGYDIGSIPNFTYQDDQSHVHSVWFEDAASLQAKINLINQYQNKGVIFWSVGLGDSQFWEQTSTAN